MIHPLFYDNQRSAYIPFSLSQANPPGIVLKTQVFFLGTWNLALPTIAGPIYLAFLNIRHPLYIEQSLERWWKYNDGRIFEHFCPNSQMYSLILLNEFVQFSKCICPN